MAGGTAAATRIVPTRRLRTATERAVAVAFGDRLGLALFVVALSAYVLTWRVGVFINDTYTVANTMAAVADGHLYLESATYGPGLETPGTYVVDGRLYGRNYGHVVLSLPFLFALEAVAVVADPRIAVAAGWSLSIVAAGVLLGRETGRERAVLGGASAVALVAFGANAALATPLDPRWFPLMALQLGTMVAAGLAAVLLYRLVARVHGRRVGLAAGVAAGLASPLAFWAPLPKRHAVTALAVVAVAYCLLRARETNSRRFRALAYVPVGLLAWVHAPEALVVLLALGLVDVATADRTGLRDLALVGGALGASLVPFLVTNVLISGDPLGAPRLLWMNSVDGRGGLATGGGRSDVATGGGRSDVATGGSGGGSLISTLLGAVHPAVHPLVLLKNRLFLGLDVAFDRPDRVWHTVVRSGYIPRVAIEDGTAAINLTVLESAPVVGPVLALPLAAVRGRARTPAGAVDLLAVAVGVGITLRFLPNLPLHAQVTVRYLVPVYLLLVYAAVRLPTVRQAIQSNGATLAWTYAGSVLIGGQLFLAGLVARQAPLGEALQAHAVVGLALALATGAWAVAGESGHRYPRVGALLLGLAAGAGTVLVLLSGLHHFAYAGDFALPLVP